MERVIPKWLDEVGVEPGLPIEVQPLSGGASNLMFRIQRGERRMVLRRPARVAVERADAGMVREYRILQALAGTDVPHATAIALCEDTSLLGCVFYVMQDVEGVSAAQAAKDVAGDPNGPRELTNAMVDALAELHQVDWEQRGLADLGQPDGFHERQVTRWAGQHEREGGREPEQLAQIGEWLQQHLPSTWSPTIMHGDYHMLNVLIGPQAPLRVAAIVDWETATIGDPLLDLAGLCEVWTSAFRGDGWPDRAAMIEHYADCRQLESVPDLRYYDVLYNFRLSVLLEGVYQRSRRDDSVPDNEMAAGRADYNRRRALELLER